jgi:hypothetical protein
MCEYKNGGILAMRQLKMPEIRQKLAQLTQKRKIFITLGETKEIFWSTMLAAFQQSNFTYGKYDY